MKKEAKSGLRSPTMPKDRFEMKEGQLNAVCGEKYATEFGNPRDLQRSSEALASYAKKHKVKY